MTIITRVKYEAAREAATHRYWKPDGRFKNGLEAFCAALGITIADDDSGPPAATRISRERYEKGIESVRKKTFSYLAEHVVVDLVSGAFAAAGIEVEPERTTEVRLAELEARVAALRADARELSRRADSTRRIIPVSALEGLVERHLGEIDE